MYREILISVESQEKRVAILENKSLEEFYVERQGIQRLVGNIYKGTVETIVPAIGAAFVNIGIGKNGFLYVQDLTRPDYEKISEVIDKPYAYEGLAESSNSKGSSDIKDMLKAGQQILVQVVKEPLGTKGPRLTTHITLPGRYLVFMPFEGHRGISRRIQDSKERIRLKTLLQQINIPRDIGLIVRTAGESGKKREFLQDLRYLTNLWRRIKATAQKKPAPGLIHEEYDLLLRIIRDKFSNQTNKLFVDSKEEYKRIIRFLSIFSPGLRGRVQYYFQNIPLLEKGGVEDEIIKIYDRKVSLKSGGYLMIEPTEALVAIDVNSGKFTGRKDPEENAYLVNLEAAKEIAGQIRLRDIGGIIIIDFIDMKLSKHRKKIFDVLNGALRRDYAKTDILAVSELGLVEMTRQRMGKSVESVAYQHCPYCRGKGLVKSPATTSISVLKKLKSIMQKTNKKTILVFAHPAVASHLVNENRQSIFSLESKFRVKILIKQRTDLHMEETKIEIV